MPSGRVERIEDLPDAMAALLRTARRGVLTTKGEEFPHAVPCCFALRGGEIVLEVDGKPKRTTDLARVRNIQNDPAATLLVDEWSEDWTRLAWVMVRGIARIEPAGSVTDLLRTKYEQYADMPLDGPVIAIEPRVINWWTWT